MLEAIEFETTQQRSPENQDFESYARAAIDCAQRLGASYCDVRFVREDRRELSVRMGQVSGLNTEQSLGVGVRVLVGGAWGYAAAPEPSQELLLKLAAQAYEQAAAGSRLRQQPVELAENPPQQGVWRSPFEEDPFEISLSDQFGLLLAVDEILRKKDEIKSSSASMSFLREQHWLYTSDGTSVEQSMLRSGAGFSATAVGEGEVQTRSYPASFGGQYAQGGYELVRSFDLLGNAERIREEAIELLTAPSCPAGAFDVIIGGSQLALQIHESVGHPNEFDRVLGFEADLAGRSFMVPELHQGGFSYGSEIVNLVADSTLPGGLARMCWDDDGVPGQRWHVVRGGQHENWFTNREFATRCGRERSFGANRAYGWRYPPQIRIPNLSLMPGEGSLEELAAGIDDGFLVDGVKTWSIDQMRVNFQFSMEIARRIEGGKLGRLYKNPTYQGRTPEFWASCDGIAGPEEWVAWGVANCGKGQPMQIAEMSHGCSPARFRGLTLL
ncbi:MAG: peptidase C69 [Planctomycetota bacterium]|nr:MAG: peptidase C69 [Planctomycetota bacterium]